jgi:branched-chain amino acid transport system permease protein
VSIAWPLLLAQLFNGLVVGSLLMLVAMGLTIIFGTLGVINFAHGALYMLGAYVGYDVYQATHSFALAVLGASAFLLVVGGAIERVIVRAYYARPIEDQILMTFGVAIVLIETVRAIFGSVSQRVPVPGWGHGAVNLGLLLYPRYRFEVLGIVAAALLVIYLVLYRTKLGLIVRAGIEDRRMVGILGINIGRTFLVVFSLGAMAAGFAGIINAPLVAVTPDMGADVLVQSFVVVVIGGVGSFAGAILGGIIAGEILSLTAMFSPAYAQVMLYAAMAVILIARPQGLLGTKERE